MTASRLRVAKSETRDFAERERASSPRFDDPTEWKMTNSTFFTALVVIAGMLAVIALVLR